MLRLLKIWLKDIRFWLLLFFMVRLINISYPPLEVAHNWRQTTVCMVARNFYENDANILYPRIDIAGEKSGITGMEFPLLNYGMYLVSEIFGYSHWSGRLINLIISTLGIWFFYLLVRFFFDERKAWFAALLLLSSLWFMYSRKAMPDTFSVSIALGALLTAVHYLYPSRASGWRDALQLLLFLILFVAGVGSKIPAGLVLAPLVLVFFDKTVRLKRKLWLGLVFLISLIPVGWWYFVWVPGLNETYQFRHFFMGTDAVTGWNDLVHHPGGLAKQFYDVPLKYSGFAVFLLGLILIFRNRETRMKRVFFTGLILLIPYVISGGFTFIRHSYYMIPFVPYMALVAAFALDRLPWKNWAIVILVLVCAENLLNQVQDFRLKPKDAVILQLDQELDRYIPQSALIAVNSGEVPTPMYFAHRKGWVCPDDQLADPSYRADLKEKGCVMIVVLKRSFGTDIQLPLQVLASNRDWTFYRL